MPTARGPSRKGRSRRTSRASRPARATASCARTRETCTGSEPLRSTRTTSRGGPRTAQRLRRPALFRSDAPWVAVAARAGREFGDPRIPFRLDRRVAKVEHGRAGRDTGCPLVERPEHAVPDGAGDPVISPLVVEVMGQMVPLDPLKEPRFRRVAQMLDAVAELIEGDDERARGECGRGPRPATDGPADGHGDQRDGRHRRVERAKQDPEVVRVLFGALYTTVPTIALVTVPVGWAVGGRAGAPAAFAAGSLIISLYEFCHCVQHLRYAPKSRFLQRIKRHHLAHHFHNERGNYGITSAVWDRVFGTLYERTTGVPPSATVFNLGYTAIEAKRYPWVAELSAGARRDGDPRRVGTE